MNEHDIIIIGAGITGLLALHQLRESGFDVAVLEAGDDVGGTWFWNRYPGARFDSESYTYQYFFSEELVRDWRWTEHFAGQPEIERYLGHVADRFALRDHIRFGTRITSATYDAGQGVWEVRGDDGYAARCRVLITAIGVLSVPQYPDLPGRDSFTGVSVHTGLWPREGVDLADKRVGVIGTSSSGVQVISSIVGEVSELVVFQRSPHWCAPLRNTPITDAEQAELAERIDAIHQTCMESFGGFVHLFDGRNTFDVGPDERRAFYDAIWNDRGFSKLLGNFQDILVSQPANDEFCRYFADQIRARVDDPAIAERLIPTDHGYGVRRPPFETDYYEVYNEDHVTLVDLRETPLEAVTPSGLRTSAREYELDVIIYATGFDAITGAFDKIAFTGRDGRTLRAAWADGPHTYMGLQSPGFPNLFFLAGAHGVGGNVPRASEIHVDLVTDCLRHMRDQGRRTVEPSAEAEAAWTAHVHETAAMSLASVGKDWAFGANTPGKPVVYRHYAGGLVTYAGKAAAMVENGWEGFVFSGDEAAGEVPAALSAGAEDTVSVPNAT
jgi:cation diffusion facilitator CzcD-associated flavoprotein CzcO